MECFSFLFNYFLPLQRSVHLSLITIGVGCKLLPLFCAVEALVPEDGDLFTDGCNNNTDILPLQFLQADYLLL